MTDVRECLEKYLKSLEEEVMAILSDPSTDKRTKNLAMKPLTAKKRIVLNTLEALEMVDRVNEEERKAAGSQE
ncbi:hypothetical protein [Hydrogenimonas sp.]